MNPITFAMQAAIFNVTMNRLIIVELAREVIRMNTVSRLKLHYRTFQEPFDKLRLLFTSMYE